MSGTCQHCGHLSPHPIEDSPPNPLHCDQCPPWPCPDCGDMCTVTNLCGCWTPLEGMALADIKALFAASDLSLGGLNADERGLS